MTNVLEDLLYDPEQHLWVKRDGAEAYLGITDHAQKNLEELLYIELPQPQMLERGDFLFSIESAKKDQDLEAPFDLEVLEVNTELEDSPELVNSEPYDSWIVKVKILDEGGVDDLVGAEEYKELIK